MTRGPPTSATSSGERRAAEPPSALTSCATSQARLLHHSDDGDWLPEATKARLNEHGEVSDLYDPDFTVDRWAFDLGEAIRRSTGGRLQLGRAELHVAANLLLHACEGDWILKPRGSAESMSPAPHVLRLSPDNPGRSKGVVS